MSEALDYGEFDSGVELAPEDDLTMDRSEEDRAFWALENLERVQNIAEFLSDTEKADVARRVTEGYEADLKSMDRWLDWNREAMKIVEPEFQAKSGGYANAKLPAIVDAAVKFSAEAYPELVKPGKVVKANVTGPDAPEKAARGERAARFLNWQFTTQIPCWEEETDRLLFQIALLGTVHRKVFWASGERRPECVLRVDGIVVNNNARSPEEASRVSDCFSLRSWEIEERVRRGDWLRPTLMATSEVEDAADHDREHEFIEQTCRIDLDRDGYDEPYVVTVAKTTQEVVQVAANWRGEDVQRDGETIVAIRPYCHYIRYGFLPPFDNGYWMMGFGVLLGPLNDSQNALLNELLDSGALANNGGGFISSAVRMPKGNQEWAKGEWKTVQVLGGLLRDSIVPLPVQPPSNTLFSLLGFLNEYSQRLSSITSVMTGEQPRANMPAASVLALIEQGKKTFSAIYKRVYRALDLEAKKIAMLNYKYGDRGDYAQFHDAQVDIVQDFDPRGLDFRLVATPEFSSSVERLAKSEALLEGLAKGLQGIEPREVTRMFVSSLITDESEMARLMPEQPALTTQQILEQAEIAKQEAIASAEVQKAQAEAQRAMVQLQIAQIQAQTAGVKAQTDPIKAIAGAERAQAGAESAKLKVMEQQLGLGRSLDEHEMAIDEHEMAMKESANANAREGDD